jgi:hypothetical protein
VTGYELDYRASSALREGADGRSLDLETAWGATPAGIVPQPRFFSGFLARPDVAAAGLLAVADVAGSRYFDAGLMKRLANMDPVVTASGDRLRFESFSLCNGVHARLDILADGVDSGVIAHGTTNVDINPPLRLALAGVAATELLHLDVGTDGIEVATPQETHRETVVELPERWIRGFAETPVLAARMTQRAELAGAAAARWLAGLPKAPPGPSFHLAPAPGGFRQSLRPGVGTVHLAGAARLAAAARISRFAQRMRVFGSDDDASAWVFDLPGARLTLLLSPQPYRGFSGEGGLLTSLATRGADASAAQLLEVLAWQSTIDRGELATATGLSIADVDLGVDYLAASGKVGFDVADAAWFHRELPFDDTRVDGDNPRLRKARELVAQGAVEWTETGALVRSGDARHWVVRTDGDDYRCSCLWWAKYRGRRGACSHVLAVTLAAATP